MIGTKIVATIGPASETPEIVESLIRAGVNVFRFNFKHNSSEWHSEKMRMVAEISDRLGTPVAILADIPGIDFMRNWIERCIADPVDYIALSYIKHPDEIIELRKMLGERTCETHIVGKIETNEALAYVEEIIHESDAIMIARGDLGKALPIEEVPYYQKRIIHRCLEIGKPVITATEMLESMIENDKPTRAEVSDVANAVYDLTDAVMLSAETALGKHALAAVEVMKRVASFTDKYRPNTNHEYVIDSQTDALTLAANDLARQRVIEEQQIKAFVIVTNTGQTAISLARLRPPVPVIAVTPNVKVRDQLILVWGVLPLMFCPGEGEHEVKIDQLRETLYASLLVKQGDHVIFLYGNEVGVSGKTNVLRIEML
jgi:pyruvate kinase